jgi:putative transposase
MGLRHRNRFLDYKSFFVTTVCKDHLPLLRSDRCKHIVAESLNFVQTKFSMHVLGYVIMPNHVHMILHFCSQNFLSACMRDLKKYTSFRIRQELEQADPDLFKKLHFRHREQLFKVWEDRFDDVWLGGHELLEVKLNYIHNNPLQAHWNLCDHPEDYRYSSAAYYFKEEMGDVRVSHYRDFF